MSNSREALCAQVTEALGLTSPLIAVYYTDQKPEGALGRDENSPQGHFCNIAYLKAVRAGRTAFIDRENPGCMGGAYYLGFSSGMREGFEYFLSHDAEGHGERFKKTPELVKKLMESQKTLPAPARYCVFQQLAQVPEEITPEVVVFLAEPDALGALVFHANYGRPGKWAVTAPFSSGCGSLVHEPRLQTLEEEPKAILGMFDVSIRNQIDKNMLSMAVPYTFFMEMAENIPGSFLEVKPWTALRGR